MEKQMYRKFNKCLDKLSKCCRPGGALEALKLLANQQALFRLFQFRCMI